MPNLKMVNPGFYCKRFIDCHNNLPEYQPEACPKQCDSCVDVILNYHTEKMKVQRVNHECPGIRIYRGRIANLMDFVRFWGQKFVMFSSIEPDGNITVIVRK